MLQASHWFVQPVLQHTPSAQFPDPHSLESVHATPSAFEQVPLLFALQTWPAGQDEVVQHTPSTQFAGVHAALDVHAVPGAPEL
jgi:hypothetical protein